MNQVPGNEELLMTMKDCSYFVTRFFEPISASATHIYHSALELSPLSSTVWRWYYDQWHTPLPRVVVGAQKSWEQRITLGGKKATLGHHVGSSSPHRVKRLWRFIIHSALNCSPP